ncbi:MAG: site-specific integrase, partial [Longimicrobiales bacterium]
MAHRLSIGQAPDGTLLLRYERWNGADIRWLKALPRARWDPIASTWRVPRSRAAVDAIRRRHPEVSIPPSARAHTNGGSTRARAPRPERPPRDPDRSARPDDVRPAGPEGQDLGDTLPDGWTATVEAAERFMLLRAFSPRTRKVYRNHLKGFARWARKSPAHVTEVDVRAYLVDLVEHRKLSRSYHSQALSAIRMLFTRVLRRPLVVEAVPQPRRERKLPVVLSRDEMRRVIDAARSPHQRALIM